MQSNKQPQGYRIYAKLPGENRYYALGGGSVVKNLIYAELWYELEDCLKVLVHVQAMNPDIKFEVRSA
jgi:hypothetical protein